MKNKENLELLAEKIRQVDDLIETISGNENVSLCDLSEVTLGEGKVDIVSLLTDNLAEFPLYFNIIEP